ncbi:hypothetical protein PO124_30930 [Bacillus licheniformis]|nr:hypothetical protein [Bacillus licheniformis]
MIVSLKRRAYFEGKDGTSMLSDVSPGEKAVSIHVYYVNSHSVCMVHTAEGVTTGIFPDETLPHMVYSSHLHLMIGYSSRQTTKPSSHILPCTLFHPVFYAGAFD